MKLCINTIGFGEGRKLRLANELNAAGMLFGIIGLAATIVGNYLRHKSGNWYETTSIEEMDKLANAAYYFDKAANNG